MPIDTRVSVSCGIREGGSTVAGGNSFAAPHIAGLVALLRSRHRGLAPFEIRAVLAATADLPAG